MRDINAFSYFVIQNFRTKVAQTGLLSSEELSRFSIHNILQGYQAISNQGYDYSF